MNLSTKLDERGIFKFFSKVGKVTDVRIIYDRNSSKSKGMAYVEFSDKKFIHAALELTGQTLNGQAITVKMSEAEKNIAWEAEQAQKKKLGQVFGQGVPYIGSEGPCKLRVGGLHLGLSEDDVKAVFEPFGELDFISMNKDDSSDAKFGSAYVQFNNTAHAMLALSQLNGLDLVGIPIRISIASQGLDGVTPDRFESIMVSAPPRIRWDYKATPPEGSKEARLLEVLRKPVDWVD